MTRALLRALVVVVALLSLSIGAASAQEDDRRALLLQVPGASFEALMGVPEVTSLAGSGGASLLVPQLGRRNLLYGQGLPEEVRDATVMTVRLQDLGAMIRRTVPSSEADELLVVVAGVGPPSANGPADGDHVTGIVVGLGTPARLLDEGTGPGSLTSDSTRRTGVVSDLDVAPTILGFLGIEHDVDGASIDVVEGPPPFELHERYLAQRRMYVPIGTAAALYATGIGLLAIASLALGRWAPARLRRVAGWGCLSVPALAAGLLAAGHLPELSYGTAVPFVAIVTVFGTMAFAPLERRELPLVPVGIGVAVLAFFTLEAVLGWSAALTPLLGGSQLDGGRFYGLPNAFIGLLVGASLWVAHPLRASAGVVLIGAVALLAGLPYLGSNLGGAVSLFAAAGLWLAVRERERLGPWRGLGAFAAVTAIGTALILVAHAVSPLRTHVTKFEESAGGLGIWDTFVDRLQVGFDLIARNPAALVPVLGLPVAVFLVLRPPASVRASLERWPAWRDAVLVTLLAGAVAYVANDSGPAAAGLAFGLGFGGLLGVSLLAPAAKMGGP